MRKLRVSNSPWVVISLLACLVLVPAATFSQDWAGLSKQLRERCTKYHGDIKDLKFAADMKASTPQGDMTTGMTIFQKGEKARVEMQMQGMPGGGEMPPGMADMKIIVIRDGKSTWMISPMTGKMELPAGEAEKYQSQWNCDDYIPKDAEIGGSETVAGRDCFVLIVKDADSAYSKLWIDKETLDLMKSEMKPQDGKSMTGIFAEYKKISGDWKFPYRIEMYQDQKPISTMTVKSVEINKGLSDDLFNAEKVDVKDPRNMNEMMKKMKEPKQDGQKQE